MTRDPNLRKRNAFLIPGGLLMVYAGLGLLYLAGWRDPIYCETGDRFLVNGACYSGLGPLALLLLVGLVITSYAYFMLRAKPDALVDRLDWGSGVHFLMWLMGSLVALPLTGAFLVKAVETPGKPYIVESLGPLIELWFLLLVVAFLAFLAFIPLFAIYKRHNAMVRDFLEESEKQNAYPGELPLASEATWGPPEQAAAPVEPIVEESPEPVVTQLPPPVAPTAAPQCTASRLNGEPCGDAIPPGKRYCARHSCQAETSMGKSCKLPALDGRRYCRTHAA